MLPDLGGPPELGFGASGATGAGTAWDGSAGGGERRLGPAGSGRCRGAENAPVGGATAGDALSGFAIGDWTSGGAVWASGAAGASGASFVSGRGVGLNIGSSSRPTGDSGEPAGATCPDLSCTNKATAIAINNARMRATGSALPDDLACEITTCVAILSPASGRLPERVFAFRSGPALSVRPSPAQGKIKPGRVRATGSLNPTTPGAHADLAA
jgi:hypothetical protein